MGKYWVSKYALTQGVYCVEGEVKPETQMLVAEVDGWRSEYFHGNGREFHETKEAAIAKAEQMRAAKIKSLEKQLKTLREKPIKVVEDGA